MHFVDEIACESEHPPKTTNVIFSCIHKPLQSLHHPGKGQKLTSDKAGINPLSELECDWDTSKSAEHAGMGFFVRNNIFSAFKVFFSALKPDSELFSEGMFWMEESGISASVLVNQVDSVSLVQLSRYLGSRASVRLPPQPMLVC